MIGTHQNTGKTLSGLDHLRQSLTRLLTTPIGSRVMRRQYGAYGFELLDHPGNNANRLKLYAATVDAILRFEPRLLPIKIELLESDAQSGQFELSLEGFATTDIGDIGAGSSMQLAIPLGGLL